MLAAWCHNRWLERENFNLVLTLTPEQFAQWPLLRQVTLLSRAFPELRGWQEITTYNLGDLRSARAVLFHSLRALPNPDQFYALDDFLAALYERVGKSMTELPGFREPQPDPRALSELQYKQTLEAWWDAHRQYWIAQQTKFVVAGLTTWLYWLGLVEINKHAPYNLIFRLTDLGRRVFTEDAVATAQGTGEAGSESLAWVVQPNFDIIVYLDAVSPAQLAFLEGHAERRLTEMHTAHYQLTRDSVYRGLEHGSSLDDVLTMLRQGAKVDLPQNVEREIRDWARQREQVTIHTRARVLAFTSPETRAQALAAGLLGTPIGETIVLMQAGASLKTALQATTGEQAITVIDYAKAHPEPCLSALEDGELLISEDHEDDLVLRGLLTRYAEKLIGNMVWQITPASLAAARLAGRDAATLLVLLQSRALGIIPPLLEITIRNALGKPDVLQGTTAFVIYISDKKLYTALTTSPTMRQYLLDVPGPDTILVSLERLEEFKAKLLTLGINLTTYTRSEPRSGWIETIPKVKTPARRRGRHW